MEIPLVPGLETLDPFLAVYDLNDDALPEIVLAAQNLVLRPNKTRFTPEDLCAFSLKRTHVALFGDFDQDDLVDYLCANLEGIYLFHGTKDGTFPAGPSVAWLPPEPLLNPFVVASGDIDGDGDLDVFLTQYKLPYVGGQMPTPFYNANDGFPSFLLLNDGQGRFVDITDKNGLAPKRHRRTYSASFGDLDQDRDLDLIVVSDFYGIDLHLNDGRGHFSDATARLIPEPNGFGMAHSIADFDLDGSLDVLMIGMNSDAAARLDSLGLNRAVHPEFSEMRKNLSQGNRLYSRTGGRFRDRAIELNIAKAGWAWGVVSFDADNDLDDDVYIVNGHNSRQTAMDYESQFWRHDIYVGTSELSPVNDAFFQAFASKLYGAGWSYGGYYKNKFFINQGGTNFLEAGYLHGLAMEQDCRNLVRADLDADGDSDLILTTFQQWPAMRQTLQAFRNDRPANDWTAVALNHVAAPGAMVSIEVAGRRTAIQTYVTGDSYRSQRPPVLHFPWPTNTPPIAWVQWPNGKTAFAVPLTNRMISRPAPPR